MVNECNRLLTSTLSNLGVDWHSPPQSPQTPRGYTRSGFAPETLFCEPIFSASIDDEEFRSGRGRGAVRGIAIANVVALAWLQAESLAIAQLNI